MIVTDELVRELSKKCDCDNKNKLVFSLSKAICMLPNPESLTKYNILRFAESILKEDLSKNNEIEQREVIEKIDKGPKPRRRGGRQPLFRGKKILGGTKSNPVSFWDNHTVGDAVNDSVYPNAQPKGNYELVKNFLKNDWGHIPTFKLPELKKALFDKYKSDIRLQRWYDYHCWESTNEVAIKPLWKRLDRRNSINIFYKTSI